METVRFIVCISVIFMSNYCITAKDHNSLENIYNKIAEARNKLNIIKEELEALSIKNEAQAVITARVTQTESQEKDVEDRDPTIMETQTDDEQANEDDSESTSLDTTNIDTNTGASDGKDNGNNSSERNSLDHNTINKLLEVLNKLKEAQNHLHSSINDLITITTASGFNYNETPTQQPRDQLINNDVDGHLSGSKLLPLGRSTMTGGIRGLRKRTMGGHYSKSRTLSNN